VNDTPADETRVSLLQRLRQEPADQHAWDEFVARYGPKILAWCRRWDLQEADAQDVTQTVLLRLSLKLREFVYDPGRSFRAWLKTLTQHAWSDLALQRRRAGSDAAPNEDRLQSLPARDDLTRELEEAFDLELLELASSRVRQRVADSTWEAFRLTALEGLSGAEAARRTGLRASHVYVARFRVQEMLREEVQKLDQGA